MGDNNDLIPWTSSDKVSNAPDFGRIEPRMSRDYRAKERKGPVGVSCLPNDEVIDDLSAVQYSEGGLLEFPGHKFASGRRKIIRSTHHHICPHSKTVLSCVHRALSDGKLR